MKKIHSIFLVLMLAFAGSVFAESVQLPLAQQKPVADLVREIGIDQKLNQQLPLDTVFHDEQGNVVKLGDYFGSKPVILNLVYFRCPMLCSLVLEDLVKALRPLKMDVGREFQIVTISIDPKDTPEDALVKKEKYMTSYKRKGAENGWHFLTGEQKSIDAVTRAAGFRYMYDSKSGQYAHAGGIMIVTPEGKLARYFYGLEYAPRDLRFSLIEASQGKIGTLVDQLLLLCFHYDPMTGKYGLFVMNFLRVAGFLTALGVALSIGMMLRSERGKAGAL